MMIPVQSLRSRKIKIIFLPLLVMLLLEVEKEGTIGDRKKEMMILELISLNLRDSFILLCSYTCSKL